MCSPWVPSQKRAPALVLMGKLRHRAGQGWLSATGLTRRSMRLSGDHDGGGGLEGIWGHSGDLPCSCCTELPRPLPGDRVLGWPGHLAVHTEDSLCPPRASGAAVDGVRDVGQSVGGGRPWESHGRPRAVHTQHPRVLHLPEDSKTSIAYWNSSTKSHPMQSHVRRLTTERQSKPAAVRLSWLPSPGVPVTSSPRAARTENRGWANHSKTLCLYHRPSVQ